VSPADVPGPETDMTTTDTTITDTTTTDTVRSLMREARIPASDAEIAAYAAAYPGVRAGVEALYAPVEVRYLDPALRFRADAVGPETPWAGPPA